jgi:HAD superfamily hydrolase (TIGR01509 family)
VCYPHGAVTVVLLDLYDTIAWTDWDAHAASVAARLGVPVRRLLAAYDQTRESRATGRLGSIAADLGALATACGLTLAPAALAEFAAAEASDLIRNVHLYDDTLPVLRRLRAAGTRLGIISNCDLSTRLVVDALALEREVDALVLSCEVGSHKPQPAIFQTTLARLSARPGDCLFVDDQPAYLDGAAALGMRTRRILRGSPDPEDRPSPHPVITSLSELG